MLQVICFFGLFSRKGFRNHGIKLGIILKKNKDCCQFLGISWSVVVHQLFHLRFLDMR